VRGRPAPAWPALALAVAAGCATAPASPDVVARFRGGVVTRAELEATLARMRPPGAAESAQQGPARRERALAAVAVHEALVARALAAGREREPEVAAALAAARARELRDALRRHLAAQVEIPEAEIESYLAAHQDDLVQPVRVRLRNLYRAVAADASEAERAAARQEMEGLRLALVAGADFAELARRESDSETRSRSGLIGNVTAGDLPAAVEAIVFALAPGELSPVVEHASGFTIFRCDRILEARTMPLDEGRERVRRWLEREAIERRWSELGANDLERAVARAVELGLAEDPTVRQRLDQGREDLLAAAQLERLVAARLEPVAEADVQALVEAEPQRFVHPPQADLSLILIAADHDNRLGRLALARRVLTDLRAGALSFADAARAHSAHPSAASGGRLGWVSTGALAALGRSVAGAVAGLEPGEISEPVQEQEGFLVLELHGRRPERPMSADEAAARARDLLLAGRRRQLRRQVHDQLVDELEITPLAP